LRSAAPIPRRALTARLGGAGSLNGTQFNNQSYAATPSQVLSIVGNFIGQ
jgi:hypothetical protein